MKNLLNVLTSKKVIGGIVSLSVIAAVGIAARTLGRKDSEDEISYGLVDQEGIIEQDFDEN